MQSTLRTGFNRPSTVLLIGLVALLGYQTYAFRPAPQLAPAVVATVNLQTMFNNLKEKAAEDDGLMKLGADLNDQATAKKKEIDQLEQDMKDHLPSSAKYQELEQKLVLGVEEYRGLVDFCKAKLDIERGRALRRIYLKIKQSAQQMSDSNGYDMVLVDDSQAELPNGTEEEMNRQISARRMLHVSKRIDITQDLIKAMNDAFAGPAAAAAGAGQLKSP